MGVQTRVCGTAVLDKELVVSFAVLVPRIRTCSPLSDDDVHLVFSPHCVSLAMPAG